jgi:polar amino acid transport system ATP-binding protein
MDRGELWEAGPPQQIFEHPIRQETHDFIFRVRSWEWTIDSSTPDLPAMEASLAAYCQRQFMGRHATNACQHIVEEVALEQLVQRAREQKNPNPGIRLTLSAGEGGIDTVFSVDYRSMLANGDPLENTSDDLSYALIMGLCERIERVEPGLMHYYLQ